MSVGIDIVAFPPQSSLTHRYRRHDPPPTSPRGWLPVSQYNQAAGLGESLLLVSILTMTAPRFYRSSLHSTSCATPGAARTSAPELNNWLWWEDRRRELFFLKAGRARGVFLSQLGAQVGVGKQGLLDRVDRLEALLRFDRPDEKLTRAARQAARAADHRRLVETRWIDEHRAELLRVIEALVHQADRYQILDEDREWIDELGRRRA